MGRRLDVKERCEQRSPRAGGRRECVYPVEQRARAGSRSAAAGRDPRLPPGPFPRPLGFPTAWQEGGKSGRRSNCGKWYFPREQGTTAESWRTENQKTHGERGQTQQQRERERRDRDETERPSRQELTWENKRENQRAGCSGGHSATAARQGRPSMGHQRGGDWFHNKLVVAADVGAMMGRPAVWRPNRETKSSVDQLRRWGRSCRQPPGSPGKA